MKQVFYYSANWCVPCQSFGPVMDKIGNIISLVKVNIDYETDKAKAANVMSIPTVILVENGQEIKRSVGAKSYEQMLEFIK